MNIEHRKTTLGDDASIYSRSKDTVTKDELKNLTPKQKFGYFKDYYLIGVAGVIAGVVFLIYFIYTSFINPSKEVLSVVFLTNTFVEDTEGMSDSLESYIGMERKKDFVGVNYYDTTDSQMNIAYMTIAGAGQLDLIICSYDDFQVQAGLGFLADMKELLPADLYEQLSDRMVTGQEIDMDFDGNVTEVGEVLEYGIDITDSAAIKQYVTTSADRVILCAFGAPPNKENALKAIEYFLQE